MRETDLLIVGGGPAGLALALALADSGLSIAVADARPREAVAGDARTLALAHGSRLILERLGAWDALRVTPIKTIHISQRGGFGRTMLHAAECEVPALGYVTSAGRLAAAFREAVGRTAITVLDTTEVIDLDNAGDPSRVHAKLRATGDGATETLNARLVVRAEGGPGEDAEVRSRDYGQHALIANIETAGGHRNTAFERFTSEGPLALLPCGELYALVHVVAAGTADRLLAMDDAAYLEHLQDIIGHRVRFTAVSARARYPLALRYRREAVAARTAWLGNAAQTLHPVAGQGFNLALRDVHALAEAVRAADDPGDAHVLAAYARGRGLDRAGTIGFTDGLIRVFSNDSTLLRPLRGAGLLALDMCGPLRGFVARRMMFGARAWP